MKIVIVIAIAVLIGVTISFGIGTLLSTSTGGDPSQLKYLVPLAIAFVAEIIGVSIVSTYESGGSTKMIVIGLAIPIVALLYAFSQNQSDLKKYKDYKAAQEATCTVTQIQQYRYKVCAAGFTPLDVCDAGYESPECINATKVWDQNH